MLLKKRVTWILSPINWKINWTSLPIGSRFPVHLVSQGIWFCWEKLIYEMPQAKCVSSILTSQSGQLATWWIHSHLIVTGRSLDRYNNDNYIGSIIIYFSIILLIRCGWKWTPVREEHTSQNCLWAPFLQRRIDICWRSVTMVTPGDCTIRSCFAAELSAALGSDVAHACSRQFECLAIYCQLSAVYGMLHALTSFASLSLQAPEVLFLEVYIFNTVRYHASHFKTYTVGLYSIPLNTPWNTGADNRGI